MTKVRLHYKKHIGMYHQYLLNNIKYVKQNYLPTFGYNIECNNLKRKSNNKNVKLII